MFTPPSKTLHTSLNKLLDCAQEYLADVCFHYPSGKIWAHRAIILARAPNEFATKHLSELVHIVDSLKVIDIYEPIIPYTTLEYLLRYWYTGELLHPLTTSTGQQPNSSSDVSSLSTLSLTSTQTSTSLMTLSTIQSTSSCYGGELPEGSNANGYTEIIKEIQDQERRLGTALLFRDHGDTKDNKKLQKMPSNNGNNNNPADQLKVDIAAMYDDGSNRKEREISATSDVTLKLFTNPSNNSNTNKTSTATCSLSQQQQQQFAVHRCILAAQSPHFYAMFCKEFREASSSTVYLSSDIFAPTSFNVILRYYYTDTLYIPPGPSNDTSPPNIENPHQQSLARKKYSLRLLHDAFQVADYLGEYNTVCQAILYAMSELCNHFKCSCNECAALLPSMLWFSDKYKSHVPALRLNLINIYSEPVHSLASLWSAQAFAILADSKTTDIVSEIVAHITSNIKKQTAIQALEGFHLCLSRIPTKQCSTVRQILDNLVCHTVTIITDNFEFYCVEYPILLSCVDGIAVGSGLSVDFLEFLLTRVMQDGINDHNAGELYQSIVRDLIGRQEMDQDKIVDSVLVDAYQQCVAYLVNRWSHVKALGGFKKVGKEIMRKLSEDIEVPYRNLTKSTFETDLASLFGFKSRSSNKSKNKAEKAESEYGAVRRNSTASLSYRRLSLLSLRSRRSHDSLATTRTSLSVVSAAQQSTTTSTATAPPNFLTIQHQSDHIGHQRRHRDPILTKNNSLTTRTTISSPTLREFVQDSTQNFNNNNSHKSLSTGNGNPNNQSRDSSSSSLLTDALLPMDLHSNNTSPTMTTSTSTPLPSSTTATRPSRLRFELPTMPQRPSSVVSDEFSSGIPGKVLLQPRNNNNSKKKKKKNKRARSQSPLRARLGFGSSSNSDASDYEDNNNNNHANMPILGAKVELLRRPLPMRGTIKYIGSVHFAKGTYVGVELENRLGNNDGAYDGVRYFHTDQQRGAFCKADDFKIIAMPTTSTSSSIRA
ncbi:hypothetical protein BDC45DRAFT_564151 [Circinella umbellata]|nr:hypothetical protein BDC45DRAFT_564151 [Circinella umbellata]